MWNITLLDRWSENIRYVVHVQLYTEREHDWVAKEICTVLNLKFSGLVVNTGLQGLEGRHDLWLVSVGVKGRDWGCGRGCRTSQREENTQFEQNLACQKQRDKEGRESGRQDEIFIPVHFLNTLSPTLPTSLSCWESFPSEELALPVFCVIYNLADLSRGGTCFKYCVPSLSLWPLCPQ